ncbi:hypothetical protein NEAUS06_0520 [Nematocida ausubeli]|nr:hypothetical protein NEAUS06_0520 [Nematocida ausubeli]
MSSQRQIDIAQRIAKIRQPAGEDEPDRILSEWAKTHPLFRKLMDGAPQGIEEKVNYLILNSHNEDDWTATCRSAEALFIKTRSAKIAETALAAAEQEKDADSLANIFYLIKKIVTISWGSADISSRISNHNFVGEKEQYLAVSISEALKASQTLSPWVCSLLEASSQEFRVCFLANLLLDRNRNLYFDIERYTSLYKLGEQDVQLLLEKIKERADPSVMQKIVLYLLPLVTMVGSLWSQLGIDDLVARVNEFPVEIIIKIASHYQFQENSINRIVEALSPKNILEMAVVYINKEYKMASEERILQSVLARIEEDPDSMYRADSHTGLLVLMSMGPEALERVSFEKSIEETVALFLSQLLDSYSEMDKNYVAENQSSILLKYAQKYRTKSMPSSRVINQAICNGICIVNEVHPDHVLTEILDTVHGREIVGLALLLLRKQTDSPVLMRCWEHAVLRSASVNAKEHAIQIERIIDTDGNDRDRVIRSKYLCNILSTLPLSLQRRIITDRRVTKEVWKTIMGAYRTYEACVLAGLTNSTTMWQGISCSNSEYLQQDISVVEGEATIFLALHILNTNYPLHYVQIVDKMKLLCSAPVADTTTKWMYSQSSKSFVYEGTSAEVKYDLTKEMEVLLSKENGFIRSSTIYMIIQEHMYTLLRREAFREYVVHALLGVFIDLNENLVAQLEKIETDPRNIEMIIKHCTKQTVVIPIKSVTQKRTASDVPSRKERKTIVTLTPEQEEASKKEDIRRTGILAAQLSVSKSANVHSINENEDDNLEDTSTLPTQNALQIKVMAALKKYIPQEVNAAAEFFCKELERYWRKEREKISSHFDAVVKIIKLFTGAPCIERLAPILSGYLDSTYIVDPDALSILKEIVLLVMKKYSGKKAFSILNGSFKDKKIIKVYIDALKDSPSDLIQEVFAHEKPGSWLHQAAIQAITSRRSEPAYEIAVNQALSQVSSRNDDVLFGCMQLLKEEYMHSPHLDSSIVIVQHAVDLLKIRTKIDAVGMVALEILKYALFTANYVLDHNSKEDIISSIKYDIYHYKDILVFFLSDVPITEFLEIIGNVNSPTGKSVRSTIRTILAEYVPEENNGPTVFTTLLAQVKEGTVSDKLFIINLLRDVFERYAEGAWITLFLKTAEIIANEEKEEVLQGLLQLLKDIVEKSQLRKKMKSICKEWSANPKLQKLVKKISSALK